MFKSLLGICLFILFYFIFIFLLFKYSCLHFPPTIPPHPSHLHLPPLILPAPLGFVHVSFIDVPENPSPFSHHYPLPPSPSGYCQFVLNFNVSGYFYKYFFLWMSRWGIELKNGIPSHFFLSSNRELTCTEVLGRKGQSCGRQAFILSSQRVLKQLETWFRIHTPLHSNCRMVEKACSFSEI